MFKPCKEGSDEGTVCKIFVQLPTSEVSMHRMHDILSVSLQIAQWWLADAGNDVCSHF